VQHAEYGQHIDDDDDKLYLTTLTLSAIKSWFPQLAWKTRNYYKYLQVYSKE
jgi:hypothetical protein